MIYRLVCPECEYAFEIEKPLLDEVVVCGDCALNLRVVAVDEASHTVRAELTQTNHQDWGQ